MSAAPPITNFTLRRHKRLRHTLANQNTISSGSHNSNDKDVHNLPHLIPSSSSFPPPASPPSPAAEAAAAPPRASAQRKAEYLAGQSPFRQGVIAKHLHDFSAFTEGTREREGRSGGYFDMMYAANREFRGLSKAEMAKMQKCRRMFKGGEVTGSMWKAFAQKVFGCWAV